ncbi:hypothetical protein [Francisella philomiragia]|uniref:hypothetical protein n=1 Tax=Francisella philomiragia TaxID=28110 RepID=UPI001B8C5652|nr:hypothetical protein [Francisella philomiragia]QUE30983.1 hypothetical protein IMS64_07085 [Francisella philomiragia]
MIEYIKTGYQIIEKIKNDNLYKHAVKESLKREIIYNLDVIDSKNSAIDNCLIIKLLSTKFYDFLTSEMISTKIIFEEDNKLVSTCDNNIQNKSIKKWLRNIDTKDFLFDKVYIKIKVIKKLNDNGVIKRGDSLLYLKSLLILLKQNF